MFEKSVFLSALVIFSLPAAGRADTIQLKDDAAVSGRILAERTDDVVVDLGYTVLVVPRSQIVDISKSATAPAAGTAQATKSGADAGGKTNDAPTSGFYSARTQAAPERSVRDLVKEIGAAVVLVRTPAGLGSGFIINEDGFLLTNFHVIEGETQISVEVYLQKDGQLEPKTYKQVRIVALNKFEDMALLKIEDKDAPKFKHVPLGSSDAMSVGERVFAIGSPLGLERTVTEGILSTKTREIRGELYLQTTAQINPGNSGGPLFNLSGEVVGITNMKITSGEGLGFAIPVEAVKYFLDHRDAYAYSNDNPSNPYKYLEPPSRTGQNPDEG
jgi:serine protease Do